MRKSKKQLREEKWDEETKAFKMQVFTHVSYGVHMVDLYMELSYYSGLSSALSGAGLYERVSQANANSAKLFQYDMTSMEKVSSWNALDIYKDNTFAHLISASALRYEDVEGITAIIDVIVKARCIIVDMCRELQAFILAGKPGEAAAFVQQCDTKIIYIFSIIKEELSQHERLQSPCSTHD